jgi:hypothetical protein
MNLSRGGKPLEQKGDTSVVKERNEAFPFTSQLNIVHRSFSLKFLQVPNFKSHGGNP